MSKNNDASSDEDGEWILIKIQNCDQSFMKKIYLNQTVDEVINQISNQFNHDARYMKLIFCGKILQNSLIFENIGIKDGNTLNVLIKNKKDSVAKSNTAISDTDLFNEKSFLPKQSKQNQFIKSIMKNNPMKNMDADFMSNMMKTNPQIKEMMEKNPDVKHMLNNPDIMKKTIEMARNPSAMKEMIRQYDRNISKIESTPGGMNLLEKLYTDVQDPLYRATQENFMVYKKEPKEIKDEDRGKLMTDPIPNPWSKKSKYTDVMLSKFKKPSHPKSILKNSKFKSNLKSSDTADIKDSNFSEDTRKFFKYLAENRLMGGSTEVSADKTNKTPVSENSKVEVDDNLLESMSSMVNMNDLSKIISSNLSNTSNQSSTQNNSEIKNDSNTMNMLTQMLQSMQTTDTMQSRDEKFTDELEQLKNMGFSDVQKNIEVLTICNGDVNAAVNYLLNKYD